MGLFVHWEDIFLLSKFIKMNYFIWFSRSIFSKVQKRIDERLNSVEPWTSSTNICASQLTTEIGVFFRFYSSNSQLKAEINVFFWQIKPKKLLKWKKKGDFHCKLRKLASNLKMNTMKMRKTVKSAKFMVIFTKIWTKRRKLS